MPSAYLLVSHGSRDPRPEIAMQQLAKLVSNKAQGNLSKVAGVNVAFASMCETLVGTAYLELSPEPLHQQIINFARNSVATLKETHLKIIPLFLMPGVHVMEDIPREVELAQQSLGQDILIELQPYLGSHSGLEQLWAKQFAGTTATAKIVLAHGSRRSGSLQPVEAIAKKLGAVTAYWAVAPSLESQVQQLIAAGYRQIAILPYFLFAGGITDAIAQATKKLQLHFPEVNFQLAEPLGASAELADLIWDLLEK
ncbi:sirohydrochlorin chelatase [Chlorogloeopsis fritschii PCC 9212]|uniref:Sirohydrochlorin chelatase n=1 Tax=Chlorogloeopsis fritschii PCC 6912 TaxID=211165 RepID=A0A433NKM4_CHLFR|nr:sirohydrochlorin chelatase [Chlorogloeopsis fritschii]MBF2005078.1 sirohydrochlorin chelatase [Chlorogloeopsis fritschii C42_A2020_084]RUR83367.1 sirohydrochlorin chelatase [Chlorogloeopsis fritschii PCC 6912]